MVIARMSHRITTAGVAFEYLLFTIELNIIPPAFIGAHLVISLYIQLRISLRSFVDYTAFKKITLNMK